MNKTKLSATKHLGVLLILVIFQSAFAQKPSPNWGVRKAATFEELQKGFSQPDMIYAPFTFWFWDTKLDSNEASAISEDMCKKGLNPGYAHAREKLPHSEWLSPLWFKSINKAVRNAENSKMYMSFCEEYEWPSGNARGRVLATHPELKAVSLNWEIKEAKEGQKVKIPESFFVVAANIVDNPDKKDTNVIIESSSMQVIGMGKAFKWKAPQGKWRIYIFNKYHHAGIDGGEVNYIDRQLAKVYLKMNVEPYEKFFSEDFGKTIPGVFNDNEGDDCWKLGWSDDLDKEYKTRYNRDIRLWMPLMVDKDEEGKWMKARWDWMDMVSDIYSDGFFGEYARWYERHNLYLTGHVWEETLPMQSVYEGSIFKIERNYTIPGNDCLWDKALRVHDFKEVQSVSEFENKRFMSEVMAISGWQMSPVFMKKAANAFTAWGVSHVIIHGINMNRELDSIPYPPDWYNSNPYWPYFKKWTDFVKRASYMNSFGHTVPSVLLVNPMDSYWALIGGNVYKEGVPMRLKKIIDKELQNTDQVYTDVIKELSGARIEYLIADDVYLRQMKLTGSGGLMREPFEFRALVIPPMFIMPTDLAEKILAFAKQGGYVYVLGALPENSVENGCNDAKMKSLMNELLSLPTVRKTDGSLKEFIAKDRYLNSDISFEKGGFQMIQSHRRIDNKDYYWLVNNNDLPQYCTIKVNNARGLVQIWDCEDGSIRDISSEQLTDGSLVDLTFNPYQAFWLVFDQSQIPISKSQIPNLDLLNTHYSLLTTLNGMWNVKIDTTQQPEPVKIRGKSSSFKEIMSRQGQASNAAIPFSWENKIEVKAPMGLISPQGENRSLESWVNWGLDRFTGYVDYYNSFDYNGESKEVILDLGQVKYMAEVWVNDENLGARLWSPFEFNITSALKKGTNRIKVKIGNLMINEMYQLVDKNPKLIEDFGWNKPQLKDLECGLLGPVVVRVRE